MSDEKPTIRIWASFDVDSLPRLVTEMTPDEWAAGKEIPRVSPLSWGHANEEYLRTDEWLHAAVDELYETRGHCTHGYPDICEVGCTLAILRRHRDRAARGE